MEIPEELRRSHEDGKVVFFCGAGVSVPAGLPSFKGLVKDVLMDMLPENARRSGPTQDLAWRAFCGGQYDEALGILESSGQGGYEPKQVREKICSRLTQRPRTLEKHLILVRLTDLDKEFGRLVTTNFDHLFEKAATKLRRKEGSDRRPAVHIAPVLPPAKPQTFQGLAYLHGKLGSSPDGKQLVLTTADFGTAYMVEGWARRFSVDLFRHYHVVFIGYRVEDPMMRYLVSALAAVREESPQQFMRTYAFAKKDAGETLDGRQWRLKGIEPLLYDAADKPDEHRHLWRMLEEWADDHRQGLTGRKQKVARWGQFPPAADENNPAVRGMAWALKNVKVARYFANLKDGRRPHPGWIAHLQKKKLLGMAVGRTDKGEPIAAPLVSRLLTDCLDLHDVTRALGHWIAESLDTQEALDWALREGGVLHTELRRQIRFQLDDKKTEIRPAFRKIWQVLADDSYAHALSEKHQDRLFLPNPRLAPDAVSAKRIFLDCLRPLPIFNVKQEWLPDQRREPKDRKRPSDWCEIEIELIGIQRGYGVERFRRRAERWEETLASIADDLTTRLREAMDWLREFDLAAPDEDGTYSKYPSISPHKQNRYLRTWTELIVLTQESYDALVSTGKEDAAERLVRRWRSLPYPVFRRLALYAATRQAGMHSVKLGLEILLEGRHPTLWDIHAMRETLRFLRKRGKDIQGERLTRLTEEILKGPPRHLYRNITDDRWEELRDREIRLRLYKLMESGTVLPVSAQEVYDRIQRDQPWQPSGDRSEEFVFFMHSPDTVRFFDPSETGPLEDFANMSVDQFIQWSTNQQGRRPWECSGGWKRFAENDIELAVKLLKGAADEESWPIPPWYTVLDVLGDKRKEEGKEETTDALKHEVAGLLIVMPLEKLAELDIPAARWLEKEWPKLDKAPKRELWRSIWNASLMNGDPEGDLDFDRTLNHAGGILGNVLWEELAECIPKVSAGENPGFPERLRLDFEQVAEEERPSGKLARARIAPRLYYIYRIAPSWTERAFFRRMNPDETGFEPHLWEGYFWSPRYTTDLLKAFKPLLFNILRNLDRIPEHVRRNGVALFVHMAVPPDRGIDTKEAEGVLWNVGTEGLVDAAGTLGDMLEGAGEKSVALWRDTIGPWFERVWPKRPQDRSQELSERLAEMAMESGNAFPHVVATIKDILTAEKYNAALFSLRGKKDIVSWHPGAALTLLCKLIHDGSDRQYLGELLGVIVEAAPELQEKDDFKKLAAKTDMFAA